VVLDNKLGITNATELAQVEEKITKQKAKQLYDSGYLQKVDVGTFEGLAAIHKYLFDEIYQFAGQVRAVNIAKGNFHLVPVMYLHASLDFLAALPEATFEQIIAKYVEMNVAHPFREGNGRSMRIWLDLMLKRSLSKVIDWSKTYKDSYLLAMERSPVKDTEIKYVLAHALSDEIDNRDVYMKGIDQSYYYEGYTMYKTEELKDEERTQ